MEQWQGQHCSGTPPPHTGRRPLNTILLKLSRLRGYVPTILPGRESPLTKAIGAGIEEPREAVALPQWQLGQGRGVP